MDVSLMARMKELKVEIARLLFSGTLYDNLLMANPQASFEAIVQACRMAKIHDTIETLPQGYQTEIGECGVGLSGGQKQRLSIARALLKQPKVLTFDEATSSLDAQTAEHFAATINQLKGRITMLCRKLCKWMRWSGLATRGTGLSRP